MERERLSRRRFLTGSALVLGGAALAACGSAPASTSGLPAAEAPQAQATTSSAAPAAASEGAVEVEWWLGWPGPVLVNLARLFEEENEGITVKCVDLGYGFDEKLIAAVNTGEPPDITQDVAYKELILRGVCTPLDDMIAVHDKVDMTDGDIPEQLWEAFAWQGQHYAVPAIDTAGREALTYNVRLVEEAGLDPDIPPADWDTMFEWHKRITTYDSAGNLDVLGMNPVAERAHATSSGDPWLWPQMWGFLFFDPESMAYNINRDETVEFFTAIKRFFDDVGVEKIQAQSQGFSGIQRAAFGAGKQAFQITYPSAPLGLSQVNPDDEYRTTWVPVSPARKGVKLQTAGGHGSLILKGSKAPNEAFELAVWLTLDTACNSLVRVGEGSVGGWLGPRRSWQKTADLSMYPETVASGMRFYVDSIGEADEVWTDANPIEGITQQAWEDALDGVNYGQLTPEQAAETMQDKLTKELSEVLEQR